MYESWKNMDTVLSSEIHNALLDLGFSEPTPVQESTIPLLLKHKDVAVEAVTGSGKTLAFLIPSVEIMKRRTETWKKSEIGCLILSPTTELATQTHEVLCRLLTQFKDTKKWTAQLLVGGQTKRTEDQSRMEREGCNFAVATPGRLVELLNSYGPGGLLHRSLKSLEILILDEADRLLELGFEFQINTILGVLPKQRRTGLFSATQTKQVENLIRAGLRNPSCVHVQERNQREDHDDRTPATLQNYFMLLESDDKLNHLVHFLKENKDKKIILFVPTCAVVDYFARLLNGLLKKHTILCIHGKMKSKRFKIFDSFRKLVSGVLVCTDVMARGVDIPLVHWVIQYEPPSNASCFVHRCGRTARIGEDGQAVLFLRPAEEAYISFLKCNQKVMLSEREAPGDVPNILEDARKLCLQDKLLYEKSMKAFVSFIQFYKKHECYLLFKFKDLDIGRLLNGFGLLKIPKMPELRGIKVTGFKPASVDVNTLPYKDKSVKRQRALVEERGGKKQKIIFKKKEPWSKRNEKRDKRREKKEKKFQKSLKTDETEEPMDTAEDLLKLEEDSRLLKKLKTKKITEEEFDSKFHDCDPNISE